MGYKAVINNPSYLCHFNKNHDPKNGRFTFKKAWETIDTAVSKGYNTVEKVAKGVYRGIKKEFKNPSNSDFDGYSTPKAASPKTEEIQSGPKSASEFKTPELNEKAKLIDPVMDKVNSITDLPWLFNEGVVGGNYKEEAIKKWGKDYVDAADIGLQACKALNLRDAYGDKITNLDRSWFVLEDQTFGMAQVAYLASIGKSSKEINDIVSANNDLGRANNDYMNQFGIEDYDEADRTKPYNNANWYLYEAKYMDSDAVSDEYINKCVEIANEQKIAHSLGESEDSLTHYNKNHSKANGQFTSGDGDGDGIVDDHHHYKKNKWAIKGKLQYKDGTLTDRGKYNLNAYKEYKEKDKKYQAEVDRILSKNKKLRDNYDPDIDSDDDLIIMAKELGINTSLLERSLSSFDGQDVKAIQTGSAMLRRMSDIKI